MATLTFHRRLSVPNPALADDLLYGAAQISEFIFGSKNASDRKRIYNLAEKRNLPVFHMASTICARKSTLLSHFEKQERASRVAEVA
jgi:hypothetical protein